MNDLHQCDIFDNQCYNIGIFKKALVDFFVEY